MGTALCGSWSMDMELFFNFVTRAAIGESTRKKSIRVYSFPLGYQILQRNLGWLGCNRPPGQIYTIKVFSSSPNSCPIVPPLGNVPHLPSPYISSSTSSESRHFSSMYSCLMAFSPSPGIRLDRPCPSRCALNRASCSAS